MHRQILRGDSIRQVGGGNLWTTISRCHNVEYPLKKMSDHDPADELRRLFPTILTTAQMTHCTIGDVRDKVHRKELPAMRWGQQFRFFRDEVIDAMQRVDDLPALEDEDVDDQTEDEK